MVPDLDFPMVVDHAGIIILVKRSNAIGILMEPILTNTFTVSELQSSLWKACDSQSPRHHRWGFLSRPVLRGGRRSRIHFTIGFLRRVSSSFGGCTFQVPERSEVPKNTLKRRNPNPIVLDIAIITICNCTDCKSNALSICTACSPFTDGGTVLKPQCQDISVISDSVCLDKLGNRSIPKIVRFCPPEKPFSSSSTGIREYGFFDPPPF